MIPKHGANSARTRKCKKYKAEGRRAINKQKHIEAQQKFSAKKQAKRERRALAGERLIRPQAGKRMIT